MDTIETTRLVLRRWRDSDLAPFAAMNADPEVMRWFPSTHSREESDASVARFEAQFERAGYGLWALERRDTGEFIGFTGLSDVPYETHFTPAVEIGWRLAREQWGQGFATEAATAARDAAFGELGIPALVSFTAVQNEPSRAVMRRIGMWHDAAGDFDHPRLATDCHVLRHVLYRLERP